MAEKSGFFNSRIVAGTYDRKYNANDYSDNLAVVISNGVLRSSNDDLKPTANGLTVSIAPGRAWINGHYYLNDAAKAFTVPAAPVGGSRYDRIILRLDNNIETRSITLQYLTGTAGSNPGKPAITRNNNVFELVVAEILIAAGASGVTLTDTRSDPSICGWVYSVSGDNSFLRRLTAHSMNGFRKQKTKLQA